METYNKLTAFACIHLYIRYTTTSLRLGSCLYILRRPVFSRIYDSGSYSGYVNIKTRKEISP